MTESQRFHGEPLQTWPTQVGRTPRSLLLVSQNSAQRERLSSALTAAGYTCHEVSDTAAAGEYLGEHPLDLLILECRPPDSMGLEYLQQIRGQRATRELPVVILMNEGASLDDRINGLNCGADDYAISPVSEREFVARVGALLRRCAASVIPGCSEATPLMVAALRLDESAQRVTVGGKLCALGPTEFQLLRFFITHPDTVYGRRELLQQLRGPGTPLDVRSVDVFVRRLRLALAPHGYARFVQTVHGSGYRFSSMLAE
jgi:two-component system phosphate regulon response regulator PhoB